MSRRQPTDPALKAQALKLADEVGAAEAARRLGLKEATVCQWRRREKQAAPPPQAGELGEVERLEQLVLAEEGIAVRALAAANAAIAAGKANDAKLYMTAHGIARDKARDLRAQLHAAREHRVHLAEAQAKQLAAVIRGVLTDLGHDLGDEHVRKVVRHRLVEGGAPPAEVVESARRALVERLAGEIKERLPHFGPDLSPGRPALPAAGETGDVDDAAQERAGGEQMVGPVVRVRALRERRRKRRSNGADGEVLDGEVVDEPSPRQAPMPGDLYADPSRWRT